MAGVVFLCSLIALRLGWVTTRTSTHKRLLSQEDQHIVLNHTHVAKVAAHCDKLLMVISQR